MKKYLLFVFAALTTLMASAQTKVKIDDIWYNLDSKVKQAEVTYKGSSYDEYDNEYSGHIDIPAMVSYNGVNYNVTSIGEGAFCFCESLTAITIPESVTSIEYGAFSYCEGLTAVHITDIAAWCCTEFGDDEDNGNLVVPSPTPLYYAHNLYLNGELITELTIPNTISRIKKYAFQHCSSLTSVTIPESVTSIGDWAFDACNSLTAVHITNLAAWCNIDFSYKSLYAHNLYMNGELVTELVIPNTFTTINGGFSGCQSLTSVIIPSSVTSIGSGAFAGCSNLESITIPESITNIGGAAFAGCSSLTTVYITDLAAWCDIEFGDYNANPLGDLYLNGALVTELTIPSSVNIVKGWSFAGCKSLTSVNIPANVDSIGNSAFGDCINLTSIAIPESVTAIGDYAFEGCSGLKIVDTGDAYVARNAFSGCKNIENLTLNSPDVGDCFMDLPMLKEVILGEKVERCTTFSGCKNLERVTMYCANVSNWFSENDAVKDIILGKGVKTVEEGAFRFCSGLTSITISDDVVNIGDKAFNICTSLKEVYFKDGSETLTVGCKAYNARGGSGLFYDCPLEMVYLGRNLSYDTRKQTGYSPFYNNGTLTSLIIGPEVTEVGENAFSGCGLDSITCDAVVPPTCYASTFTGVDTSIPVYVPEASVADYQSAEAWKDFLGFVGVDAGIEQTIVNGQQTTIIYDLQGRKVTDAEGLKGIYIVNGKKTIIK